MFHGNSERVVSEAIDKCIKNYEEEQKLNLNTPYRDCSYYWKDFEKGTKSMENKFMFGVGLPVIFFGGKTLLNYIFPEVGKKKKFEKLK
jgi:hypothetical protein